MRIFWLFILSLSLCLSGYVGVYAQQGNPTKAQLESKRRELQDAIRETERQLADIKNDKTATLGQLKALQYKLAQRQRLIANINDEIDDIDHNINSSSREIDNLQKRLVYLKTRYAQSIRYAYASRSSYGMLAYLFSAANFNDAIRRMKYLKKFRDYRKEQVEQIVETKRQIGVKIEELSKVKTEKDKLLMSEKEEKNALQEDVNQTNTAMKELKGKESELLNQIKQNKRQADLINRQIQAIITREMEEANRKARELALKNKQQQPPAGNPNPDVKTPGTGRARSHTASAENAQMLTPTDAALADNFEGNKGKLYWPVTQGYICDHFGKHRHQVEQNVMVDNSGIDICTLPNTPVRAVFEGTVSGILNAANVQIVMIRHGNFFTVYTYLSSVSVTKGQHVTAGQNIGVVGKNAEGQTAVKFQISKSSGQGIINLDPEQWIIKVK
ncbi:MAG: hypothetical protein EBX41_04480 [Chitinophagia bacterium]|nr:hypothetical protein [Chitinophagia bacterium]